MLAADVRVEVALYRTRVVAQVTLERLLARVCALVAVEIGDVNARKRALRTLEGLLQRVPELDVGIQGAPLRSFVRAAVISAGVRPLSGVTPHVNLLARTRHTVQKRVREIVW